MHEHAGPDGVRKAVDLDEHDGPGGHEQTACEKKGRPRHGREVDVGQELQVIRSNPQSPYEARDDIHDGVG